MIPKTIHVWDTELSADSVEWCPNDGYENLFAVGTYQVDKNEDSEAFSGSQRSGKISLHKIDDELSLLQTLDVAAVLDMKWAPCLKNDTSILPQLTPRLAVVDAKGMLSIYNLSEKDDALCLEKITSIHIEPTNCDKNSGTGDILALSLDWNSRRNATDKELEIAVSSSKGTVSIFSIKDNLIENIWNRENCHEYEAWITSFDAWNRNVIFTGGDDGLLKIFDRRSDVSCLTVPRRHFGAGVTSLLSDIYEEHILFSGSYDENLHTWDVRNVKNPLKTLKMGGGVWRIRQITSIENSPTSKILATACMHAGFKLLDKTEMKILTDYEHESLAYGIDFKSSDSDHTITLASCSFYDHTLKIWNFNYKSIL